MDFAKLAAVIESSKKVFEEEHPHLPPTERDYQWHLAFAAAQQKHSTLNFGLAAKERSASHPPLLANKRQKLANGSCNQIHNQVDNANAMCPPSLVRRASHSMSSTSKSSSRRVSVHHPQAMSKDLDHRTTPYAREFLTTSTTPSNIANSQSSDVLNLTEWSPDEYTRIVASDPQDTMSNSTMSYNHPISSYSSSPVTDNVFDSQTNATSVGMSRGESTGSLFGKLSNLDLTHAMSREPSNASHYRQDDMTDSTPTIFTSGSPRFLGFMGGSTTDNNSLTAPVYDPSLPQIVEATHNMERSASNESSASSPSRLSQRTRDHVVSARRHIAPASGAASTCASLYVCNSQRGSQPMSRESSTGSQKIQISRVSQAPPKVEKVKCEQCNDRPNGYRGAHELARHTATAHGAKLTVFICVEKNSNTGMLSDCEQCRNFKQYKAYYNAAAHFRRRHHNKKPQGVKRNGKVPLEEKRGGKAGGKEPPMEVIKKDWLLSFEVDRTGRPVDSAFAQYYKPGVTEVIESKSASDEVLQQDSQIQAVDEPASFVANDELEDNTPTFSVLGSDSNNLARGRTFMSPNTINDLTSTITPLTETSQYPQHIPDELVQNVDADTENPFTTPNTEEDFFTTLQTTLNPFDDFNFQFEPSHY